MAKKGLGDRVDPQVPRMPAEDDPDDARLTPPAGLDLRLTADETTQWRRRRAEDAATARSMLRWTRIGAIAAVIGIILAPQPSQKDQPLSRTMSATSSPQTVPAATMPATLQAGSKAGGQDAQTVAAPSQSPPRKNAARGSVVGNKATHIHGGAGFDFVAPSPFSNDNLGGTP